MQEEGWRYEAAEAMRLDPTPIALAVRMAVLYPAAWAHDLGVQWQRMVVA